MKLWGWRRGVGRCVPAAVLAGTTMLGAVSTPSLTAAEATHAVAPGQTLAEIASEHGVSVNALAALNDLSPVTVFDQSASVVVPGEGDHPFLSDDVAPEAYIVAEGDTIESIAAYLGVSVAALAATNNLDDPDLLQIGQRLLVPVSDEAEEFVTTAGEPGGGGILSGVLAYQQARSLSCEYASVYIATSIFGDPIYEEEYLATTPSADNPHFGFRGNIDGEWGRTDDYGIYAEALVPTLESHGYVGEVSYGADGALLRAQIDAGHPVIVWIATRGDTGFYEVDSEGNAFKLVPWEHVVVVYGYDDEQVYISDPGPGAFIMMSWDSFLPAWSVMDGMALAVYPA